MADAAPSGEADTYDVDWLTGPHAYEFTSARSDRQAMSAEELTSSIRDLPDQVDPATGYLD